MTGVRQRQGRIGLTLMSPEQNVFNLMNKQKQIHLMYKACTECKCLFVINVFSDPMSESERTKFALGAAGLLLGLVVLIAGGIYYKCNNTGERQHSINKK